MKINNKVIVIGGNHHNTLGVIRALGEKGIKSYVIITNDNKYAFVKKSKYVIKSYIVRESKDDILDILLNQFHLGKNKTILIPTSDFAAITIDNNLDQLKDIFIVPQIDNKQGMIAKYMDKYVQYKLAKKYDVPMAESIDFNLFDEKKVNIDNLKKYPYIVKPIVSAYGSKADMRICNNIDELQKALEYCKGKNFKRVLIQEFIEYDYEIGLLGCIHNDKLVLPGIISKIRRYPEKYGTLAYARVHKKDLKHDSIRKIVNLLSNVEYSGMYDIDVFVRGNQYFLNEINFRNSGNSIAYCFGNVYLVYLWVLMVTNHSIDNEPQEILEDFTFVDEYGERNLLLNGSITLEEYQRAKKTSKGGVFHRKGDLKPTFYKYVYAVCRRVFK